MKNILIIGANGYLGRNLSKYYENKTDFNVTLLDINGIDYTSRFPVVRNDILNKKKLENNLKNKDLIYNFAGHTDIPGSFDNYKKDIQLNCLGMLNILDSVKNFTKKPLIVFPSSRVVYGKSSKKKIDEKSPRKPDSIYGIHKESVENYLMAYNNLYDIPYLIFRLSIPYGFHSGLFMKNSNGFINYLLGKTINNETINIFGNGNQRRDIININDFNEIIFKAVHELKLKNNIYNLGGTEVRSILEIAEMIVEILGGKIEFVKWDRRLKKLETGDMVLDSSRLYKKIHYCPEIKLKDYLISIAES